MGKPAQSARESMPVEEGRFDYLFAEGVDKLDRNGPWVFRQGPDGFAYFEHLTKHHVVPATSVQMARR